MTLEQLVDLFVACAAVVFAVLLMFFVADRVMRSRPTKTRARISLLAAAFGSICALFLVPGLFRVSLGDGLIMVPVAVFGIVGFLMIFWFYRRYKDYLPILNDK